MAFYDLAKEERLNLVAIIKNEIADDIANHVFNRINSYFNHADTYIRKAAYLS
jgi:hypothetical protein